MRFFIAFCISLFIYILLIWIFIVQFSKVELPLKKTNNHVIKIDIRNIPDPKPLPTPKSEPIVAVKPVVPKPIEKKTIKKKPVKPKIVKKKVVKKKVIKKKIVKKEVKKKPPVTIKPKPKVVKKSVPKEEEIIYISDPFITKPVEKKAEKSDDLASFLGSAVPSRPASTTNYPNKKIKKLYGSTFHTFTPTQKKFIENNLDDIQGITQQILTRRGYPEGAERTRQEGTNVVSFNLHPNGNISGLRLKRRIGYRALDDNTLELIKTAYKDYPYPTTTTKIVFYVTYSIYGY